jgi:glutathione synthase/RimK-type ligase-like ATP-grasp enzyme
MLLVLTNQQDFAVDHTILRLEERGVPFIRVNSEDVADSQFTFDIDAAVVARTMRSREREINVADITSVWLRRQLQPSLSSIRPEDRAFAATEMRFFLDAFFFCLRDCTWVNSPYATYLGERKLHVLERAAQLGLAVPRTIATNNPTSFHERPPGQWIAKPLYQGLHSTRGQLQAVYTQRLEDYGEIENDEIRLVPCIYQAEVPRGRDLRLTFVGDHAFGATVLADTLQEVDWRRPESRARFERYEIPDALFQSCRRLMNDLGLTYGAFDFIEDRDGKPWFLEVNPAGEFAWLEVQLGFLIRDALIDLFSRGVS